MKDPRKYAAKRLIDMLVVFLNFILVLEKLSSALLFIRCKTSSNFYSTKTSKDNFIIARRNRTGASLEKVFLFLERKNVSQQFHAFTCFLLHNIIAEPSSEYQSRTELVFSLLKDPVKTPHICQVTFTNLDIYLKTHYYASKL